MADEDMARVRITKTVTIHPDATTNVLYEAGVEVTAPRSHIEQIVAAGCGERIDGAAPQQAATQQPAVGQQAGANLPPRTARVG